MRESTCVTTILVIQLVFLANNGVPCLELNITVENQTVLQYRTPAVKADSVAKKHRQPLVRKKRHKANHGMTERDINGLCISFQSRSHRSTLRGPIHKVIVADEGGPVSLTCHFCNDSSSAVYNSLLWYRIGREESESGRLPIAEVVTDMKDNEKNNRLVVTPTHTLIFKKITEEDAGGYFCSSLENMTALIKTGSVPRPTNSSHMFNMLFGVTFFYHVDVLPSKQAVVKRVSMFSKSYDKPTEDEVSENNNLLFFTDWQEWTRCSVCGSVGERLRYGVRMVTKNSRMLASKPWFLDKVLNTYDRGVPCRSTLLREIKYLAAKKDEIEIELCDITCHRQWIYSKDNTQKAQITSEKWRDIRHEAKTKVVKRMLTEAIGEPVKLDCPGSNLNSLVWWKNGTKTLPSVGLNNATTDTRVRVDPYGNLVIQTLLPSDGSKYSCWLRGRLRAIYKLNVRPETNEPKGVLYHLPYIGTVLSFHFWLFVCSLVFRYYKHIINPNIEQVDNYDEDSYYDELDNIDNQIKALTDKSPINYEANETEISDDSDYATTPPAVKANKKDDVVNKTPTQPKSSQPKSTQPKSTQQKSTQQKSTQQKSTQPKSTQPKSTQQKSTQPKFTQPESTKPKSTQLKSTQPKVTQPEFTQQEFSQPEFIQRKSTQLNFTLPKSERKNTYDVYSSALRMSTYEKIQRLKRKRLGPYVNLNPDYKRQESKASPITQPLTDIDKLDLSSESDTENFQVPSKSEKTPLMRTQYLY